MRRRTWCAILLVAALAVPGTAVLAADGGGPLTNADVVELVGLNLGDDVVVAKIRQADEVDFDLATDDLVALKSSGVSSDVIAAMLERDTPAPAVQGAADADDMPKVRLVAGGRTIPLTSVPGAQSSTYAWVTTLIYMDYPGLEADTSITDDRPAILLVSDTDPENRCFIVQAERDEDDGQRSVKMGKSGMFSQKRINMPDEDWRIAYEAAEVDPGVWKLTLVDDLDEGEYGLWVAPSGDLWDFSVK